MQIIRAGLVGLCLLGCSRGPSVVVTVADIPAGAGSLQLIVTGTRSQSSQELEPFNLEDPAARAGKLRLDFPESALGDVSVAAAAYGVRDASGCLLGTGDSTLAVSPDQDGNVQVALKPVMDPLCTGQRPLLLGAAPGLGLSSGGESVALTGWGFLPGSRVTFNGAAAPALTYRTPSSVEVSTPARVGLGPAEIQVTSPSGASHARADLFRFFTGSVDFSGVPGNDTTTMFDIGGLVVGGFYPSNPRVLASMALSMRALQEVRLLRAETPLAIYSDRVDLKPLAPAGQTATPAGIAGRDMDGDGIADLVVAIADQSKVVVIKNDGAGRYTYDPLKSVFTVGAGPQGLAVADAWADSSAA